MTDVRTDIVAMTAGGPHAWIMINALREAFGRFPILQEAPEPANVFWARRRKRLGFAKVASMQAARLPIRLTKFGTASRIQHLIESNRLNPDAPLTDIQHVPSVNDQAVREALKTHQPKVIFVVSTRMIGRRTLAAIDAPFINYHSGINPAYRGMYGGYFALANGEPEHFGTTVHLVDAGVDTGDVLYQTRQEVSPQDNFHTYLWTMAAGSREAVIQAVQDALDGRLTPYKVDLPSRQYFAPTFSQYITTGLIKGVW